MYRYYLGIGGAWNFVFVIAVTAVAQALSILSQFLLARCTRPTPSPPSP